MAHSTVLSNRWELNAPQLMEWQRERAGTIEWAQRLRSLLFHMPGRSMDQERSLPLCLATMAGVD